MVKVNSGPVAPTWGPCPDRGYYLVGLSRPQPGVVSGLAWSRDTGLADTLAEVQNLGWSVPLLPSWPDIDTFADLQASLDRPRGGVSPAGAGKTWSPAALRPDLP
jgi:glycosyltransferase A (GT-A) superfamily protein (DUF2064 family)